MNLMSNDCSAGLIYKKVLNTEYKNPLIFKKIHFDDYVKLVKFYDNINFSNYELTKNDNWKFALVIDNIITVELNHYKFDVNVNGIKKKFPDVYSNRIWEYIVNIYEKRLNRTHEKPIFVGHFDYGQLGEWDPQLSIEKLADFCTFIKNANIPFLLMTELPVNISENETFKIIKFSRNDGDEFIRNKYIIINKLNELAKQV